ncbi:GntR family transcriptional regulator [Microbaculum sp. FT89]|uniref:GntR family transcriptional regulator n=1 Tax=Microbaculum sp. FT89 TaxID=3447298 RepID=UPI003F53CF98
MKSLDRPKSLTELVTETLRDWIVKGELDLGSHLSEVRIANDLKVSRTPVREAINRLEIEGLLTVRPQRGTFVFCLEPDELAKLCDARVCLETTAMAAAIQTNPERLYASLLDCATRMTDARRRDDVSLYLALDTEFHQHLLNCSGNRFLNDAYQTIAPKMAALRNRLGRHPDHLAKSYREHLDLVEAVKDRDTDRALEILKLHIDRKEGSYWNDATRVPELHSVGD